MSEICGWDGCKNKVYGLYRITDSFDRTYEKTACKKCAEFWKAYRQECTLVHRLKAADEAKDG